MLNSHFHEDFDADAVPFPWGVYLCERPSARYSAVHGAGALRIGHGNEEAHANFVAAFAGLKRITPERETLRVPRRSSKCSFRGIRGGECASTA